jgi:hypothetical protein
MSRKAPLRAQQNLDRTALIHRAIRLGYLVERQGQVEDLVLGESDATVKR